MKKNVLSIIALILMATATAPAQGPKNDVMLDFESYIINLIKSDWVLHNTQLRYVNSHEEDRTISVEEMKAKYSSFIEGICKRHKDSMCLLVQDTSFLKVVKPYEADYTLYSKLNNKQICFMPYSKVKHKVIQGFINKNTISDEHFDKLYRLYGIRYGDDLKK